MKDRRRDNTPLASVVIEPIHEVTDSFIDEIGSITKDYEAALIVDERNTGCASSGNGFWAYNGTQADYLVFGKKT